MAYVSPAVSEVMDSCGLREYMTQLDPEALAPILATFITDAETFVANQVTDAVFDGTSLSARKYLALAAAVRYRAGAILLRNPKVRMALGTQHAYLAEGVSGVDEAIASLEELADAYVEGVLPGAGENDTAFALPAFATGTFTTTDNIAETRNQNNMEYPALVLEAIDT